MSEEPEEQRQPIAAGEYVAPPVSSCCRDFEDSDLLRHLARRFNKETPYVRERIQETAAFYEGLERSSGDNTTVDVRRIPRAAGPGFRRRRCERAAPGWRGSHTMGTCLGPWASGRLELQRRTSAPRRERRSLMPRLMRQPRRLTLVGLLLGLLLIPASAQADVSFSDGVIVKTTMTCQQRTSTLPASMEYWVQPFNLPTGGEFRYALGTVVDTAGNATWGEWSPAVGGLGAHYGPASDPRSGEYGYVILVAHYTNQWEKAAEPVTVSQLFADGTSGTSTQGICQL